MRKKIKRQQYSFYYSKRNRLLLISFLVVAFFFFMSVGYSLFNTTFGINTEFAIRPERDIRIVSIGSPVYNNGAYEVASAYYSHDFLGITGVLPNDTSTIEYTLLVTNKSSVDMAIEDVTANFNVEGVSYELVGFLIGDEIASGISVEIIVRFKRDTTISNTTFRGELTFTFGNAYVDITPPTIVFNPGATDTWSTEDINVNISASDDRSIISFKYCVTTDSECTPDTNADISGTDILLSEGKSVICAEAIDNAKDPNITSKCTNQYLVDKTPPDITIDGCDTSGDCTINIEAYMGTYRIPTAVASDALAITDTSTISSGNIIPNVPGIYEITYIAQDTAGNIGTAKLTVIVKDTISPTFTTSLSNVGYTIVLDVEASDTGSGLHEEAYSFDDGVTWQAESSKVYKSSRIVNVRVRDVAGNVSDAQVVEFNKVFVNGEEVYYNPTTGTVCDEVEAVSLTETKDGCMKWYAFNDSEDSTTVNLLLDHNTTAIVRWSSNSWNTNMTTLSNQLASDIANWEETVKASARLITADEIAQITGNTSFSGSSTLMTGYFYFDTNSRNASDTCTTGNTSGCKYGWLYDRTATDCTDRGCYNNSDVYVRGFWTSTKIATNLTRAWCADNKAALNSGTVSDTDYGGVRPVITVDKYSL